MENKVKKISVLQILSLVFAILSALTLLLAAGYSLLLNGAEIGATVFLDWYYNGTTFLKSPPLAWMNVLSPILSSLQLALVAVVGAVLLLVCRRKSVVFIPFGFLTSVAFGAFISTPAMVVKNLIGNRINGKPTYEELLLDRHVSYAVLGLVICVLGVLAMAVLFVVALVLKKLRPIPMALICLTLGAGSIASFVNSVFVIVGSWNGYMHILRHFQGLITLSYVYDWFVSPFLGIVTLLLLCAASFFAIFAVLPYKTKKERIAAAQIAAEETADQ